MTDIRAPVANLGAEWQCGRVTVVAMPPIAAITVAARAMHRRCIRGNRIAAAIRTHGGIEPGRALAA